MCDNGNNVTIMAAATAAGLLTEELRAERAAAAAARSEADAAWAALETLRARVRRVVGASP
jgi:hypothetical protein